VPLSQCTHAPPRFLACAAPAMYAVGRPTPAGRVGGVGQSIGHARPHSGKRPPGPQPPPHAGCRRRRLRRQHLGGRAARLRGAGRPGAKAAAPPAPGGARQFQVVGGPDGGDEVQRGAVRDAEGPRHLGGRWRLCVCEARAGRTERACVPQASSRRRMQPRRALTGGRVAGRGSKDQANSMPPWVRPCSAHARGGGTARRAAPHRAPRRSFPSRSAAPRRRR
jgi:hypothetical protein